MVCSLINKYSNKVDVLLYMLICILTCSYAVQIRSTFYHLCILFNVKICLVHSVFFTYAVSGPSIFEALFPLRLMFNV